MRQTRQAVRAINKSIFLIYLWFMLSHIFMVTLSVALFSADMLSVVYAECHIFIVIQSVFVLNVVAPSTLRPKLAWIF